jgi:glycine/D-amino acid oxidase-like deaminating enzyme
VKEAVYWLDTLPKKEAGNEQEVVRERVDVLVVGAGYTGLSAARRLAKSGATVLVVEREHIGFGASSRNAGQALTGLRLDPKTLVARYGESQARQLFKSSLFALEHLEALLAAESIDCEYERTGHIQAAWKAGHFESLQKEQAILSRVFGHPVEVLSKDQQRREIGSDCYHGVLVDQRSGALNPAQYVNGLAFAAKRAGAAIATGITVERLNRSDNEWTVTTNRGPIRARDVLIATNGYTGAATPMLQRSMVSIGSYSVVTEPLAEADALRLLPNRRMAYDSKQFLYYFRLTRSSIVVRRSSVFTQRTKNTTRRAARFFSKESIRFFRSWPARRSPTRGAVRCRSLATSGRMQVDSATGPTLPEPMPATGLRWRRCWAISRPAGSAANPWTIRSWTTAVRRFRSTAERRGFCRCLAPTIG